MRHETAVSPAVLCARLSSTSLDAWTNHEPDAAVALAASLNPSCVDETGSAFYRQLVLPLEGAPMTAEVSASRANGRVGLSGSAR